MTELKALIFDVDGTLVDTEEFGHLPAVNDTFKAFDVPIAWRWDEFRALLPIPGNALRMRMALDDLYPDRPADELDALVKAMKAYKRQRYIDHYLPELPLRPGVRRIIDEALTARVRLAIVSTSDEAQIHALLKYRLADVAAHFNPIFGKESGTKTAPDSPLHRRVLAELGVDARNTIMIEDSSYGFAAALRAGIPCAVIYNEGTLGEDFSGAPLVARSLEHFSLELLATLTLPA